jgi:hypothetical protein
MSTVDHKSIEADVRPVPGPALERLDSWKEIAVYLGREVRTAQRWESCEGLPVHRHSHAKGSSVWACKHEIDAWLHSRDRAASGSAMLRSDSAGCTIVTIEPPSSLVPSSDRLSAHPLYICAVRARRSIQTTTDTAHHNSGACNARR